MSSSSKSEKKTSELKRKFQDSGEHECEKPLRKKMAWDSYTSTKDFGYTFNGEGRLVDENGDGFNFYVSEEDWYNQKNYEALGEIITEHVYGLLQSEEVGLQKLEIPLPQPKGKIKGKSKSANLPSVNQKDKEAAKGFIFVSEKFDEKEKLIVLVHGSGVVRAGQWARRLIINDCLDHGTQIPFIKQAIEEDYGVLITNTNQNEAFVEVNGRKMLKRIKKSESPEAHFSYVWKNVIEESKASKIFVVAHSYGGYLVVDYFTRSSKILDRIVAVAFTDSVHSLRFHSSGSVRKWFLENSVNWVTSNKELDEPLSHQDDDYNITRVSAGTTKHEETSWKAKNSIFKYFHSQELGHGKKGEKSSDKSGSNKSVAKGGKNKGLKSDSSCVEQNESSKESNKTLLEKSREYKKAMNEDVDKEKSGNVHGTASEEQTGDSNRNTCDTGASDISNTVTSEYHSEAGKVTNNMIDTQKPEFKSSHIQPKSCEVAKDTAEVKTASDNTVRTDEKHANEGDQSKNEKGTREDEHDKNKPETSVETAACSNDIVDHASEKEIAESSQTTNENGTNNGDFTATSNELASGSNQNSDEKETDANNIDDTNKNDEISGTSTLDSKTNKLPVDNLGGDEKELSSKRNDINTETPITSTNELHPADSSRKTENNPFSTRKQDDAGPNEETQETLV